VRERDERTAVVLISTELDEVLGLADRIAVMYQGRIIGELSGGSSAAAVGLLMAGSVADADDIPDTTGAAIFEPGDGGATS
jgi:energy-coupling factor transporter ATP-binding protein EcfA2